MVEGFDDILIDESDGPGILDDLLPEGDGAMQSLPLASRVPTSTPASSATVLSHLVSEIEASSDHRGRQRLRRAVAKVQGDLDHQVEDMSLVAGRWDQQILHVGSQMAWQGADDTQGQHPLAWDTRAAIKLAFSCVGNVPGSRARETHRANDVCAAVAFACSDATRSRVRAIMNAAQADPACEFLVMKLAGDGTPMNLRYGPCADMLSKIGRHWHRENARSNWTLLSQATLKHRGIRFSQQSGVLEVFAARGSLHFEQRPEGMDVFSLRGLDIPTAPVILQNGTASTMFNAFMRHGPPGLELSSIEAQALSGKFKAIVICTQSDTCAAMTRMRYDIYQRLRDINRRLQQMGKLTRILSLNGDCLGHIVHSMANDITRSKKLMPKMYYIWRVFRQISDLLR